MARILIVDDSAVQRTILKKYLEKDFHEIVAEAKFGSDVLPLYKEHSPDIVFIDVFLPDLNGVAVLSGLMNYDNNAKVIMFSSSPLETVIIQSIQLGAGGFIAKPVSRELLIKSVNNVFRDEKTNCYAERLKRALSVIAQRKAELAMPAQTA